MSRKKLKDARQLTFGDGQDGEDGHFQRSLVVHPFQKSAGGDGSRDPHARLEEAVGLAAAINLEVVEKTLVALTRRNPATFIGRGRVDELAADIEDKQIDLVIMDCDLAPVQQRNLERAFNAKVIDRTGLILEIFGERASTKEGELQVELAHLEYQRSRLVRSWTHLERQRGGFGFMGGPGETQIEADRRMIDERMGRIKRQLQTVTRTRSLHRKTRKKAPFPVVALVGYTNAGKSTLFNRLTKADVMAADMLFATLDPTMRAITLPSGRKIILSDTVGFISDLPPGLVAAFRATLEEVVSADLILHVRDVAHPDSEAQRNDVIEILRELGVGPDSDRSPPILDVLNKADLLDEAAAMEVKGRAQRSDDMVLISALSGAGCDDLAAAIDHLLGSEDREVDVHLRYGDGKALAWLHQHGKIIRRRDESDGIYLKVAINPVAWGRYCKAHGINADLV